MGQGNRPVPLGEVARLAARQHGVVTRAQLIGLGLNSDAIHHRVERGRLHRVWRSVYALGQPELTPHGNWMAAVLSCGPRAVLSHLSAAGLWGIVRSPSTVRIDVSVPGGGGRRGARPARPARRPRLVLHRRPSLAAADVTRCSGIPVTNPACTLVDLAGLLTRDRLEAAVNEADKLGLTDPEQLRVAVDALSPRTGTRALRELLDRHTFVLTDSELERRFLQIARRARLDRPVTGKKVCGFKVDFLWPDLGLVVETDGLTYHRTPAQQARDRLRDQAHAAAGLTCLRFTHAQVRYEPEHVARTLHAVAERCRARGRLE